MHPHISLLVRTVGRSFPTAFDLDFRLIGRLHRFVGRGSQPVVAGNGFWLAGRTSNAAYISGINERQFMSALADAIEPGQVVYNLGANIGYLALWLVHHFRGQLDLVAFEPEPGTFAFLKDNVSLNTGYGHVVKTEQAAVGERTGVVDFVCFEPGSGQGAIADGEDRPGGHVESVQVVTLDKYVAQSNPPPDWIIMDVEGHGSQAIAGAATVLRDRRPAIAAEIHTSEEERGIEREIAPYEYRRIAEFRNLWGYHVIWAQRDRTT